MQSIIGYKRFNGYNYIVCFYNEEFADNIQSNVNIYYFLFITFITVAYVVLISYLLS